MLANNKRLIEKNFKSILDKINYTDESKTCSDIVFEKNSGMVPTVFIKEVNRKVYLHSKYNPYKEAERIIEHIESIGNYDYVVFFGFGLGYHVEYFINKYPYIPFSIFEPKFDVFRICLESRDISFLEKSSFDSFYFPNIESASEKNLEEFLSDLNCNILVIPLVSYETAFPEEYCNFYQMFGQYFISTAILDNTKKNNEKLHTVNTLKNFNFIINTPNILRQSNASFKGKPGIIVSAGPSLEYEIENLRYIKENNLAYIFSAGSAINTLLDEKIFPHACWSIDPKESSQIVYKKMISMGIKSIPLIFGTTTGSEVVRSYPGSLYHFITSKDLVTPYYLGSDINTEEIVDTASSVAVVTLLALHRLGFSPIILVGQNLAYNDQRYYANGIDYNQGSDIIENEHFEHLYKVQSVDGSYIYSDEALNCFRKDMEHYIRHYKIDNVINTTRNGAAIKGTTYMSMDELLKHYLMDRTADPEWELKLHTDYNRKIIRNHSVSIKTEIDKFYNIVKLLNDLSDKIYSASNTGTDGSLGNLFYGIFNDLINNEFFHIFLYSMNVYECKILIKYIKSMRNLNSSSTFSLPLFERFIDFINVCLKDLDSILPLIEKLDQQISLI